MIIEEIMLVMAVCVDLFFSAFAYAQNGIKIPFSSAFLISFTGAGILTLSMQFSGLLSMYIPASVCIYVGSAILFMIGAVCLFNNFLKDILKKSFGKNKNIAIDVLIDECCADKDNSKILSFSEAFLLSLTLSADALASGMGAGLTGCNSLICGISALLLGLFSIYCGTSAWKHIADISRKNFSWIGGLVLIILAVLQLIP